MASPTRVTLEMLCAFVDEMPAALRAIGVGESFALGLAILKHYFGQSWTDRYIVPASAIPNFLRINMTDPLVREITTFRVIELGEILFNLQEVEGFDACIARMRDGVMEGTYAELEFGRMLFLNKVPFRFVLPSGMKGADYDIEISYPDGVVACADAKCKIEGTAVSYNTIANTLKDAHRQLPRNRPGIAFIKVPNAWMQSPVFDGIAEAAARDFLRKTSRVVSVKFYVAEITTDGQMMRHRLMYKEFSNPDTQFEQNRNWDVFQQFQLPKESNGMPSHWQRILFFPDGKIR